MTVRNLAFSAIAAIACAVPSGAVAATHTWGPDISPAAGDVVEIPGGVTAYVNDAATYNKVRDLSRIRFVDATSRIVFDVPAGETWTLQCTIRGDVPMTTSGAIAAAAYNGGLVKKGGGDLEFTIGSNTADFEYFVYTPITVEAGAVVMPQNYPSTNKKQCLCGPVTVSNGAYFVTSCPSDGKQNIQYGVTQTPELWGEGTVSNRCNDQRFIVDGKKTTSEFRGTIGWGIRYLQKGYVNLMGDMSGSSSTTSVSDDGIIGVKKFGLNSSDSASSITKGSLEFMKSGTFRYLGVGETTRKSVLTREVYSTGPAVFDGGTNGALVLAGTFQPQNLKDATMVNYMHPLAFDGDHPNPCELSGSLSSWTNSAGLPATYTVAKRGTGTWKFSNKATPWSGALFVENGTLQATSIGNIGEACSLGYATNRTAFAKNVTAGSAQLPYAICLGSEETAGTLEYVGDGRVDVTNRPIALAGVGGALKNSSSSGVAYRGVTALADSTFTVSGDTEADNIVADVCDGDGKVSLVKDGSGCWTLDGTNSFTGTLSVKAGTLYVNDPTKYSWFRWVLKERWLNESGANSDANVRVAELGIYDDQNRRINGGLVYSSEYSYLRPGSLEAGACAIDRRGTHRKTIAKADWPLDAMFDDGTPVATGNQTVANVSVDDGGSILVDPSDPSTWIPVVMHLTNGAPRAASFDVVQADNSTNTNRYFKAFDFEGSIDGIHWDSLASVTVPIMTKNKWVGSGASYSAGSAGTHTGGYAISGGPAGARKALDGVESVSVAAGARLVSRGDVEIRGLTVDMNGAGTIENFSFAANGTLDIVNPPRDSGELPASFLNCSGMGNIAGWGVKVNGSATDKWFIRMRGDRIYVIRRGFVLVYR